MGHKKTRKTPATNENWRLHDTYQPGPSCNRIVTRSQSAFLRLKSTPSDLDLFADSSRHHPPERPCLMETLKGKYGSIPRTITTRSFGKHISTDFKLREKIDFYKKYEIKTEVKTTVGDESENKNNGGNKENNSYNKIRKENQVKEEKMKKKQAEEERMRKEAEEKAKKEEMRKRNEEEENNNKQAEKEEKKRIQAEEEERKKMQADEEERNIRQAEEEEITEKQDEEQDDEDNDQNGSGSFLGPQISLKSLSNIFNFGGNNNEKNQ